VDHGGDVRIRRGACQKPRLEALGGPIDKDAFKEDDVVVEI
jgi:hypothetical protein